MFNYEFGSLKLSIVSDGAIELPEGYGFYRCDSESDMEHACVAELNDGITNFGQNVLIIDSPLSGRTIVDPGVGLHQLLHSKRFGPGTGQLTANLVSQGISPESVDRVLITHLHPDHCWGLIDSSGAAAFNNADVYVHQEEIDYWLETTQLRMDIDFTELQRRIGALFSLRAYGERVKVFVEESEIALGILAQPSPGHTPGHSVFRFHGEEKPLISMGDTFHNEAQIAHPSVRARTDTDSGAEKKRRDLLETAYQTQALVHAYHFQSPGLGFVEKWDGVYRWKPLSI